MKNYKILRTVLCIFLVAVIGASTAACSLQSPPVSDVEPDETGPLEPTTPTASTDSTQPATSDCDIPEWELWDATPPARENVLAKPLFSISMGGGFGTIEETATKTWTVYDDGTVDKTKLNRRTPAVKLSDEDFDKLLSMVTREKVESLEPVEDWTVMDGGGTDITFYDDMGEVLIEKGGYSPKSDEYQELYWDIYRIVTPYVEEWEL